MEGLLGKYEIKLRSAAISLFDVRRSSFETTLYGINVTREWLQNNLELTGDARPVLRILTIGIFL